MNIVKLLRFFFTGPGAVLVVVALILGVSEIIREGQERQKAEAEKRQIHRPLGKLQPSETVDKSTAPKDVILSDKRIVPATTTDEPAPGQTQAVPLPNAPGRGPLPQLVSFYAQVTGSSPSPARAPEALPKDPTAWLPPGIFIPCALVNTVESSHINTPVVGEVLRDVYQNGHLIIRAGSILSSFAQSGAVRDRIEVAGVWLIVYPDGRHLRVRGIACDREADPSNQQFGIEDGSAGLEGELIESDHWANAKAFIALLMTASMQTGTAVATSALQASHTTGVVGLPDTAPILGKYLDQLLNGETGDGRFVRVRASKEFYVFVTETVLPANRTITDEKRSDGEDVPKVLPSDNDKILGEALKMEQTIQNAAQPQEGKDESLKFSY
jgi:type F conjugative transfer system protein TrbI